MSDYWAFGLHIDSEIELGSLMRAPPRDLESAAAPTVQIRWGAPAHPSALAPVDSDGWYEFDGDRHRFGWAEVGIIEVLAAKSIIVWPSSNVAAGLVEHVLLGPIFADILLSLGHLPLHASASCVEEGVVAFVGQSGRGKSTLAAAMHANGYSAHGDDLIAVPCGDEPQVQFGISRIKLNADSASATGADPETLPRIYAGIEKRARAIEASNTQTARRLKAIYRLVDDETLRIVSVEQKRAIFELLPNCFRVEVEQHACGIGELLRRCTKVLDHVPLFELHRPRDYAQLAAVVAAVAQHAQSL